MEFNILYTPIALNDGGREDPNLFKLDKAGMHRLLERNTKDIKGSKIHGKASPASGSIYAGDNTILADLDHLDHGGMDRRSIIEGKMEDIMSDLPFLIFVKESNNNLHFICYGSYDDESGYRLKASFYLACIARAILKHTGLDLRDIIEKGKCVSLDTHNTNPDQRLFVYPGKKYWEYPFEPSDFQVDNRAFDGYEWLKPEGEKKIYKGDISDEEYMAIPGMRWKKGCNIDVSKQGGIEVCGYTGHDARWRLAQNIYYMTGWREDLTRSIISSNFLYPDKWEGSCKKLYENKYPPNSRFIKWLEENLLEEDPDAVKDIEIEGWMIDRMGEIEDFYNKHHRIMIQAPTGTGKTTLVNGMEGRDGLAKKLNAIVIVPFNSMVHLYNRMICIKTDGSLRARLDDYRENEPCAIIWDQVLKLWDRIREDNRVIIVDESHTLFLDRRYRDSAVSLMEKLKTYPNVICISATPCGEVSSLGLKMIKFSNTKRKIKLDLVKTDKPMSVLMLNRCRFRDWYDRVLVFSDNHCRKMHSWLTADLIDHTWLHTWNAGDEKMERVWNEEKLIDPVTLSTSLGFNGVNFNNERERVLIVLDGRDGILAGQNIVQMIGRIRKSSVKVIVYWGGKIEGSDVDEEREAAKLLEGEDHRIVHYREDLLDEGKYKAAKEIEEWLEKNADYETVLKYLKSTGYVEVKEKEDMVGDGKRFGDVGNAIRKEVELGWKEEYMTGLLFDIEGSRSREKDNYRKRIDCLYGSLQGKIPERVIRKAFENAKADTYSSTILSDLLERYLVAAMGEEDWKWHVKCLEKCVESTLIGDVLRNRYKKKLEDHKKMREESIELERNDRGEADCGDVMMWVDKWLDWNIKKSREDKSKAHSKSHKPHKPHKKALYRCWDGFEGTVEQVALHTGKGLSTTKRMIKDGKIKKLLNSGL